MCGILGYAAVGRELGLKDALAHLRHRGPDAQCVWNGSTGGVMIGLGHARLSILDLSDAANQPFSSADGRYQLIFNGEIYNHESLRSALQAEGVRFRTRSDTEVLLAAYQAWGEGCLPRLDGMFAFALYDSVQGRLVLARDQFGIKPLYIHHDRDKGVFAFGSEVRALASLAAVPLSADRASIAMFLLNGFLYEPHTGWTGISKLGPGEVAVFDAHTGQLETKTYHDPLAAPRSGQSLQELVSEAVHLQALADVPVGLFLSGGLDSTVVALEFPHDLTGLFVDYGPDGGDLGLDRRFAGQIAERLQIPLKVLRQAREQQSADTVLQDFHDVARGVEEPISDFTYIATREISRLAVQSGFKVMLSGMGGDELFAGYPRHKLARRFNALRALAPFARPIGSLLSKRPSFAKRAQRLQGFLQADDFVEAYTSLVGYFSSAEAARLTSREDVDASFHGIRQRVSAAENESPLKRALYLDYYGFLSHNLTVTDRASMSQSLEVRVPLLTPKIAAWTFAQPDAALIGARYTKKPLQDIVRTRLGDVFADRPKQGFNPPLDAKIALLGPDAITEHLRRGKLSAYVDLNLATDLVTRHFSGQSNETYRLWQLFFLASWLDGPAS